jgi:hypothetical protein
MPISGAEAPWCPGQGPNKYERPFAVNHYFPFFLSLRHKSRNQLNWTDSFWDDPMALATLGIRYRRPKPTQDPRCKRRSRGAEINASIVHTTSSAPARLAQFSHKSKQYGLEHRRRHRPNGAYRPGREGEPAGRSGTKPPKNSDAKQLTAGSEPRRLVGLTRGLRATRARTQHNGWGPCDRQ